MKRLGFIFLNVTLVLALLIGCSNSDSALGGDEYIEETDYPYNFHPESSQGGITPSDQGYYLLNGNYIYYMDKDSTSPVLLDNRPNNECLKENAFQNCNAFVSLRPNSTLFQFYQGNLYTIEYNYGAKNENPTNGFKNGVYELVKRDPDGTQREVLRTFLNANLVQAVIHRGYLYYIVEDYDKDKTLIYQILRHSLRKITKEPEVIFAGTNKEGGISRLVPYGTHLYFLEWPGNGMFQVMRYDLTSEETSVLWDQKDGGYPNIEGIHNKKLYHWYYYYNNRETKTSDITDKRGLKIYTSDLDGSHIQETAIQASSIISKVFVDDDYIYVRPIKAQLRRLADSGNQLFRMK